MPLFHKNRPLETYRRAVPRSGFSTKRVTRKLRSLLGSGSPRSIYPNPVTGPPGVIPKVTREPSAARGSAAAIAACRTGRPVKLRYDRDDDILITAGLAPATATKETI